MQRTIKFRAWDKLKKKVVDVAGINFVEGVVMLWKNIGVVRSTYYVESHTIELMQFTGLLDKNGKPIYEGDIVQTPDQTVWEMLWNDRTVAFDMRTRTPNSIPPMKEAWCSPWLPKELEVIGNIYENPDFLKEE